MKEWGEDASLISLDSQRRVNIVDEALIYIFRERIQWAREIVASTAYHQSIEHFPQPEFQLKWAELKSGRVKARERGREKESKRITLNGGTKLIETWRGKSRNGATPTYSPILIPSAAPVQFHREFFSSISIFAFDQQTSDSKEQS